MNPLIKQIKLFIAIIVAAPLLQFSPVLLESLIQLPVPLTQLNAFEWTIDVRALRPGKYYISIGRPQGACEIALDGVVLESTKSGFGGVRTHLLLGGGFEVPKQGDARPRALLLSCTQQSGFSVSLFHRPIVAEFYSGVVLQLLRGLVDVALGPLFSAVLLFSLLFANPAYSETLRYRRAFVVFASVSLLYTMSLSHFTTLFLNGGEYTIVHTLLRTAFSAAFLFLCGTYSKHRLGLIGVHLILLIVLLNVGIYHHDSLSGAYNWCFLVFPLSAAISAHDLLRADGENKFRATLGVIASAWAFLQVIDSVRLWFFTGPFMGPSIVTVITVLLAYHLHRDLLDRQQRTDRLRIDFEKRESLVSLSSQVAHDIRAPLAALSIAERDIVEINDAARALIQGAIARIRDISDDLLEQRRQAAVPERCQLMPLVEKAVNEATFRLGPSSGIRLLTSNGVGGSHSLWVSINEGEFQRVMSNLLNNAFESMSLSGDITVAVKRRDNWVEICVSDTGKGIPEERLNQLGVVGRTFDKEGGSGLGLFYARSTCERWGGRLDISSKVGRGTTVTLFLPLS